MNDGGFFFRIKFAGLSFKMKAMISVVTSEVIVGCEFCAEGLEIRRGFFFKKKLLFEYHFCNCDDSYVVQDYIRAELLT